MDEHDDGLTQARLAYAAHDWTSAAALFDGVPPERFTADDLAAYAAFLAGSRTAEAAHIAMVFSPRTSAD